MTDKIQDAAKELLREAARQIEWDAYSGIGHTEGQGTMLKIIEADPSETIKEVAEEKGISPQVVEAALVRLADEINPDWKDENEGISAAAEIDDYNAISEDWQMFSALYHAQEDRRAVYVHRSMPDSHAANQRLSGESMKKVIAQAKYHHLFDYHDSEAVERFFCELEIIDSV